jgi:hypothetical protein
MSTVMVPNRPMFSLCAGGHVGEYLLVDPAALATELVDREPQVLRHPGDHRVRGQRQTPCLLGLLLQAPAPDSALVGVHAARPAPHPRTHRGSTPDPQSCQHDHNGRSHPP